LPSASTGPAAPGQRPTRPAWRGAVALVAGLMLWAGQAEAIVGPAQDGAALAPFVVMVLNRIGTRAGFCSAIVVAPTVLLTAAHCVPPGAALKVHFPDEGHPPVLLDVAQVVRHPGYRADAIRSRTRSIDLALIRLPAPLPARFRPAMLADGGVAHAVGEPYRLAGYGLAREGDPRSSGRLLVGAVAARAPLSDVLLWAEGAGSGACEGDSGGPVLAADRDTVAAVMVWSAGKGAAQCGALTQAVWLAPHRDWMAGILRGWGAAN
jgi:hypothetical protein